MITRPDLAHLAHGETRMIDGVLMRHMGDGRFHPAAVFGEPILKRFDSNEGEMLHRWMA